MQIGQRIASWFGGKKDPFEDAVIVLKIKVPQGGVSGNFFSMKVNVWPYTIDWGDGTSSVGVEPYNKDNPRTLSHSYESEGEYFAKVIVKKDSLTYFSGYDLPFEMEMVKFDQSRLQQLTELYFHVCKLEWENPDFTDCANLEIIGYIFRKTKVSGTIPDLTKLRKLKDVKRAFQGCEYITDIHPNVVEAAMSVSKQAEVWPMLTYTDGFCSGTVVAPRMPQEWGGWLVRRGGYKCIRSRFSRSYGRFRASRKVRTRLLWKEAA